MISLCNGNDTGKSFPLKLVLVYILELKRTFSFWIFGYFLEKNAEMIIPITSSSKHQIRITLQASEEF